MLFPRSPDGWMLLNGRFLGTNKMLHMQRSAGTYQGKRVLGRAAQAVRNYDRYATEVRRIRTMAARQAVMVPPLRARCWLGFILLNHHALDPSAWYLPGKAAEDGLVTGRLIVSDRSAVLASAGTVTHSADKDAEIWQWATGRVWIPGTTGMLCMWWCTGEAVQP